MRHGNRHSRRDVLRGAGLILADPLLHAMQDDAPYGLGALLDGSGMVRLPAGDFVMGSRKGLEDEQPEHRVRLSHGFEIGKFEVTQAQWETVMSDAHPSPAGAVQAELPSATPSHFKGARLPVDSVSWDDIQRFLTRLNGRDDKHLYRLPTEAEWEYACRSGSKDEGVRRPESMAWHKTNSGEQSHPVGLKAANAWGLHDMHGNVAEWVRDWYAHDYYENSQRVDPAGPNSGSYRVFRGACWFDAAEFCRPSLRRFDFPGSRFYHVGFRVVRTEK